MTGTTTKLDSADGQHGAAPHDLPSGGGRRHRIPLGAAVAVGIAAVQLLFVFCLGYPPLHAAPHDLPVGVAGPPQAVRQVRAQLAGRGDAFDVHHYSDATAARAAVENREVYGALVVTPSGPRLLVATAANPAVAAALRQQAAQLGQHGAVPVNDVVPAAAADPKGTGSLTTLLPLVLISLALGVAVALLERRRGLRLVWVSLAAILAGLGVAELTHSMGTFAGNYWAVAAVSSLLVFGIGAVSAGLAQIAVAGRGLAALMALLILNIGIPGAGAMVPHDLLVQPWRATGPYLPPGAAVDAMRGVGFFAGAGTSGSLLVLAGWALVGLVLIALPTERGRGETMTSTLVRGDPKRGST